MNGLMTWFGSLGWLANATTIGTALLTLAIFVFAYVKNRRGSYKLSHLIDQDLLQRGRDHGAKSIAKIEIIDDEPGDFPTRQLKDAGLNVVVRKQVSLADTDEIALSDIVFLDMKGVVKDDFDKGGMRLISSLRSRNPVQKICAVSGASFDVTATDFFQMADDRKQKPLSSQECMDVIDLFVDDLFGPSENMDYVENAFKSVPRANRRRLIGLAKAFLKSEHSESHFRQAVSRDLSDAEGAIRFVNLVRLQKNAAT